jgi:hypothetical protein
MLLLVVLATVVLAIAAVPSEPISTVDTPGSQPAASFGATTDDPADGAWSRAEAEQFACSGNNVPEQICSADIFAATP